MMAFASAAALALTVVMMAFAATAAFAFFVMMMALASAAALTFIMVMVALAAAAAFAFTVVMMTFAAAAAFAFFVVMMALAAAAAFVIIMVMMSAAATAAFPIAMVMVVVVMVMASAAATAAAVMRTGQRNGDEGFVGGSHRQADALEHGLVLLDARHGKAVFGLSHAHAACGQGIHGLLHEVEVARHLENLFDRSFNLVEAALFVDKHVAHFEGTHLSEGVFDRLAVHHKGGGKLMTLDKRQTDRLGTVKNRLCGFAVKRKKLRNAHF